MAFDLQTVPGADDDTSSSPVQTDSSIHERSRRFVPTCATLQSLGSFSFVGEEVPKNEIVPDFDVGLVGRFAIASMWCCRETLAVPTLQTTNAQPPCMGSHIFSRPPTYFACAGMTRSSSRAKNDLSLGACPRVKFSPMIGINLTPTKDLHARVAQARRADAAQFLEAGRQADAYLAENEVCFEIAKKIPATMSALLLGADDQQLLQTVSEQLWSVVEQALDWVIESPERLGRFFSDHRRIFPYLNRVAGLETWQGYSRYDAAVTPRGEIKVIELNTACPAGYQMTQYFNDAASVGLKSLSPDIAADLEEATNATIPDRVLIDELLAMEAASGITPGLVGLVNDENQLHNELSLFVTSFDRRGREARVIDAAEIGFRDGAAYHGDDRLSVTYNKIRVSTEDGPMHHWGPGFETRYEGFLAAQAAGAMVSVNNMAAASIGEDKGFLAVLQNDEFQSRLTGDERSLIDRHVLWTRRLTSGTTRWQDEEIDLLPFVEAHRELFVLKPANEGRGFGVLIGPFCDEDQWRAACRENRQAPYIVQEYAEMVRLPVIDPRSDSAEPTEMFLTLAMAITRGRYCGVLARISPNPVNNVGREGVVQAVLRIP